MSDEVIAELLFFLFFTFVVPVLFLVFGIAADIVAEAISHD